MAAIAAASFFMAVPRRTDIALRKWHSVGGLEWLICRFPACVALSLRARECPLYLQSQTASGAGLNRPIAKIGKERPRKIFVIF
jgi:hypothetical protein